MKFKALTESINSFFDFDSSNWFFKAYSATFYANTLGEFHAKPGKTNAMLLKFESFNDLTSPPLYLVPSSFFTELFTVKFDKH